MSHKADHVKRKSGVPKREAGKSSPAHVSRSARSTSSFAISSLFKKKAVDETEKRTGESPKLSIPSETGSLLLVVRLVVSAVVFAFALIFSFEAEWQVIALLAAAAAIAGYDIVLSAVNAVTARDFLATPVMVSFVAFASFFIGFGVEGAALVILYQIGLMLISYVDERTRKTALELLTYQDSGVTNKIESLSGDSAACHMHIEDIIKSSASGVLVIAIVFAVIYAITLPIITSFNYAVSIHRALMIILIATPMSVVVSMPLSSFTGLCYSAQQGIVFNNAEAMEKLAQTDVCIFDATGIFTADSPKLLSSQPNKIDENTFMTFVSHAVYYSTQPFAKAISSAAENQEYKLEVVSNFRDIAGFGVELKLGEADVIFATRQYYSKKGIRVPADDKEPGTAYYLTVSNRYLGKVLISSDIDEELVNLTDDMKAVGFSKCILLSEEGKDAAQRTGEQLYFDDAYGECDTERKLSLINDISESSGNLLFVYSSGIEAHSAASLDMRVSSKSKFADALVLPDFVINIPFSKQVARRVQQISATNAILAFAIKAILIFLSIIGYCNIWFAIFIDMAAAIGTVLISVRVTSESPIAKHRYKSGN